MYPGQMYDAKQDNRTSERSKESLVILSLPDRKVKNWIQVYERDQDLKQKEHLKLSLALAIFQTKYYRSKKLDSINALSFL